MPLVDGESQRILREIKHDYKKMTDAQLNTIIRAVSAQDAGNYDGKYVGTVAMAEQILRSSNKTQMITLSIALLSLLVSIVALLK